MTGTPKTGDRVRRVSWTGSRGRVIRIDVLKGERVAVVAWQPHGFVPACTAPCKLDDLAVVND